MSYKSIIKSLKKNKKKSINQNQTNKKCKLQSPLLKIRNYITLPYYIIVYTLTLMQNTLEKITFVRDALIVFLFPLMLKFNTLGISSMVKSWHCNVKVVISSLCGQLLNCH